MTQVASRFAQMIYEGSMVAPSSKDVEDVLEQAEFSQTSESVQLSDGNETEDPTNEPACSQLEQSSPE